MPKCCQDRRNLDITAYDLSEDQRCQVCGAGYIQFHDREAMQALGMLDEHGNRIWRKGERPGVQRNEQIFGKHTCAPCSGGCHVR